MTKQKVQQNCRNLFKSLMVLLTVLLSYSTQAQLALPFSENFDAAWTTLPTASWINTFTGNRQWHREDYTTGWGSSSGSYAPAGANSTSHSARFHSYDATSGQTGEFITPALNFSPAGTKMLEFWHINTSGTDKLQVYLSTDGGTTWSASLTSPVSGIVTSASWSQYIINLGATTSNNCKIKFVATSDWGTTDIGLDNISVTVATPMAFSSCTTTQNNTTPVSQTSTQQEIVCVQILTTGSGTPFNATGFTFNTTGSTAPATDITNAKLWYTGTSSTFATTTQVGATVAAPNGVFTISPTQVLSQGTNYFWLTYDIPATAVIDNVVDAQCTQITMSGVGGTRVPSQTNPTGSRPIKLIYIMNNTPVTTCGGVFTDAGGLSGNYALSENYTKTFTSANGTHLRFDFISFSTEATWDLLKVYDGPTTASPLIGVLNGSSLPETFISYGTTLTFKFTSDAWNTFPGWAANISCIDIPTCSGNPPANDNCLTATPITNINGFCGNTSSAYLADSPGNLASVFCVGSIDNNSWFSFIADSVAIEMIFLVSNCINSDGIQVAVYETSDCNTFNLVSSCWNPSVMQSGVITASGLTVGQQYYLLVDGYDGDDCDYIVGASEGVDVTLPIELAYFKTICAGNAVNLIWQTASETNNDYFTIEKSNDMIDWRPIAVVDGAGNSNSALEYMYIDKNYEGDQKYYRLKQTDFDGKFSYSKIETVNCQVISIENVFPNPSSDEIVLSMISSKSQNITIIISDELGRNVEYIKTANEGTNEFKLDISHLAVGTYSLMVISSDGISSPVQFLKR